MLRYVAFNYIGAIVWPELADGGLTILRYVALTCCYRLAGALVDKLYLNVAEG